MKYYLTHGLGPHYLEPNKKISLRLKSTQYQIIQGMLCMKNYDCVLLRCLEKRDVENVLSELQDGLNGGNFIGDTTAHKILRERYYCPNLFKYSHTHARKCLECQKSVGKEGEYSFPLQPMIIEHPFQQWGLDVIREINPYSSQLHKYILKTIDYFTRWA